MRQELDRSLGFFSCLNISTGTMIGSAIFVLAGISYQAAGPSAFLAVFLAGVAAIFTALSFAEIVTFIPRSGGGYAYVREATNNGILGFLTGWGFWLGYSMACGIFAIGFGNFINYLLPFIPKIIAAYSLVIYVTATNIKGMKNSDKLQNIITTILLGLLFVYIIYGFFNIELIEGEKFLPNGISGMFSAVGFLYMTYIGYGLITTASEEVINPEKTIPKAIIVSLLLVIAIKTLVFFIGSAVINWEMLIPGATNTPMIDTAVKMGGFAGGILFAGAGILATVSSINTSLMAASRTSFAMSRDRRLPSLFKNINQKTKTPIFSILVVAIIIVIAINLKNLERISTITSIFSLTGYSLVNIALIIFRKKYPNIKRGFKVPFYPILPILGVVLNLFLVFQLAFNDIIGFIISGFILIVGLTYYYFMLPKLRVISKKGIGTGIIPDINYKKIENNQNTKDVYKIIVPIAHPKTTEALLELGAKIARHSNGSIIPLHVVNVPEIIPLDSKYNQPKKEMQKYETVIETIRNFNFNCACVTESIAIVSRDVVHAIKTASMENNVDLILLGWSKSMFSKKAIGGITHKVLERVPKNVGILKKGKNTEIKSILYPYGGGYHSQITLEIIKKIACEKDINVTFFRVEDPDTTKEECDEMQNIMKNAIKKLEINGRVKIIKAKSIVKTIIKESANYDMVILGASSEWGIKNYFTGSITDEIMDEIECSGLIIRGYDPITQKKHFRRLFNLAKQHFMD